MAYYNNNNQSDLLTKSAVWVEKQGKDGKPSRYFSFTFSKGDTMFTCRVYSESKYTPKDGKHKGKKCCPVRIVQWQGNNSYDSPYQKGGYK